MNFKVGVYDWDGLKGLTEDALYKLHVQNGGTDDTIPCQEIVIADCVVRHMAENLHKRESKIDDLIGENDELRAQLDELTEKYAVLKNGLDKVLALNKDLSEQNEALRTRAGSD